MDGMNFAGRDTDRPTNKPASLPDARFALVAIIVTFVMMAATMLVYGGLVGPAPSPDVPDLATWVFA